MEYYNGIYCISARELIDGGIVSQSNYNNWINRGKVNVVHRGGGAKGSRALIAVDSLPHEYRLKVEEISPGGPQLRLENWIISNYTVDQKAARHYSHLKPDKCLEYTVNASVLNTCIKLYDNASMAQRLMHKRYDWEMMSSAVSILKKRFGHTLPSSMHRFKQKVNSYKKDGYESLISGKFGNQSARLLTDREGQVLLGIAVMPNKPWNTHVREMYRMFAHGELDVWHPDTGELLDPEHHVRYKDGEPWIPSESTVNNFLNRPDIKTKIRSLQLPGSDYYHEDMPHVHRRNGSFSLSQITMDDVNLSRRMKGNEEVFAYYAYDMVSQCVLAASYSRKKNEALVDECFRELFREIKRRGWGIPAGIEVENHLMTRFKDSFLKEGVVFSRVRYCAPQNHQDKYAEPLNGGKKRSVIHKNHEQIGRFYGKGKWKVYYTKVSDETNQTWLDKKYYSFEELVADDRRDNMEWNNSLHTDQARYPGKTRWEVLMENLNPDLREFDEKTVARYIGERVSTTIRRHSYCRVAGKDWWLSSPRVLERLAPNNMKVEAYYLPTQTSDAENVFIYQGGNYLDSLEEILPFTRIMAEQTDEDRRRLGIQMKKIKEFKDYIGNSGISPVMVMPRNVEKVAWHDEPPLPQSHVEGLPPEGRGTGENPDCRWIAEECEAPATNGLTHCCDEEAHSSAEEGYSFKDIDYTMAGIESA